MKLMVDVGRACMEYQDKYLQDLNCKRIECDEVWSFCYAKKKNVPENKKGQLGYGDVWTWTAIDPESKLIVSYLVGQRNAVSAQAFISDLAARLKNNVQVTTDGLKIYVDAIEQSFGADVDYAMLVKMYGDDQNKEKRYSPSTFIASERQRITGNPDPKMISTSIAERSNLTIRMTNRRFTRLTNAFSKKIENLTCSVALTFMHYNFCRIHGSIKVTPAMEAGITDHVWDLEDVAALMDKEI
jgi:IS1 family transposase